MSDVLFNEARPRKRSDRELFFVVSRQESLFIELTKMFHAISEYFVDIDR